MNPASAQHDSEKIKETSQNYGNKFDKAVDDAMAQAKALGKDAEKDLKKVCGSFQHDIVVPFRNLICVKSYEDIKTKAGNFADDASAEAQKKFADAKAELTKATEETKVGPP